MARAAKPIKNLEVASRGEWRRWLEAHHGSESEVWLVFYKRHTGVQSLTYEEAVQEALCFGWIDSKTSTLDETRFRQIFTPRKPKSIWARSNKERVARLIGQGVIGPQQRKVLSGVAERVQDRLGVAHLLLERGAVGLRLATGSGDHDLARAVADRAEQEVDADRSDVEGLDRNYARRQPLAAAHRMAPDAEHQRAAVLQVVEQQAGILAPRLVVGGEQGLHSQPHVGHARIGVAHRARRADGRTPAAARAQVRLDFHVIAVGADRAGRTDVDAAVAARTSRAAVRAKARLVLEEARLLEFADQLREAQRSVRPG